YLHMRFGQATSYPFFGSPRKVERGFDAELPQVCGGLRTDAPHLLDVEIFQVEMDVPRLNCGESRGLLPLRGELCDDFVGSQADGEGEAKLGIERFLYLLRHGDVFHAERS